jgi:hypothetical protein
MAVQTRVIAMTVLLVAGYCTRGYGQVAPPTILVVDVENLVHYREDTSDLSKFATDPNVTTPVLPRTFYFGVIIGDIVAVNGQPAKGTMTRNRRTFLLRTAPDPGQGIADTVRGGVMADSFEILKSDGNPIGTIVSYGLAEGAPPLGGPLSITQGSFAIVGGTGAFLGARGQFGNAVTSQTIAIRDASVTEDPANRRRNGGGRAKFVLQVIPMSRPEIIVNSSGPAVVHANDFTPVRAANPATSGELLILYATGLGPTRPGVDPGKPFTTSPQQIVNSPVEVTVNGTSAEVLYAGGFPGSVDGYHVSFRLPSVTAAGEVSLQLTSAFIPGPEVKIAVK